MEKIVETKKKEICSQTNLLLYRPNEILRFFDFACYMNVNSIGNMYFIENSLYGLLFFPHNHFVHNMH